MRIMLLAALAATAAWVPGAAHGEPSQRGVVAVSCVQAGSFFNVQIAGSRDGNYWTRIHRDVFSAVPPERVMVAVWSFGSQATREPVLHGWISGARSRTSPGCVPSRSPRRPRPRPLRPAVEVKDGWAFGRRYECRQQGPVVIETRTLAGETRMTVWMQKTRELIATAEISGRSGSLRASKRCAERSS